MKRVWSSYNIKKSIKEYNPRKIQSMHGKKETNISSSLQMPQLKQKNYFPHDKKIFHKFNFKNMDDDIASLLDSIKVQTGFNKYSNIAGKKKIKKDRLVSAGTFVDMPVKSTKSNSGTKIRVESGVQFSKKKRNFSSKLNLTNFYQNNPNFVNSILSNSLSLINFNKNVSFLKNDAKSKISEKDDRLNKTINMANKNPFYNININLGTLITNQQSNKEKDDDGEKYIMDKDLEKFLQEKKDNLNDKNNIELLKIRTDYLIKFAKINELYKKLYLISDCFRVNFRKLYSSSIKSLIKYFDLCSNFLLNEIKVDKNNVSSWIKILNYIYNLCFQTSKLQKFFYDEIHFLKTENLSLQQNIINQESELNTNKNDLNKINKLIIKYDLNSKIKKGKQLDNYANSIKKKFTNRESDYVLTIFNLKQEIQNLTEVLNKNKPDLHLIESLKEQLNDINKKYDEEVDRLTKLNGQKSTDIQVLSQRESNLYEQINELENEINILKDREQNEQEKNIILNAKIENLNKINEKNNKIIEDLKNDIDNFKQKKDKEDLNNKVAKIVFLPPT